MATDKKTAEAILQHVQRVCDASIRPMMGDYLLYIDGKVAGQINEGGLFIKVTPFGDEFAQELEKKSPYPGAKPAFVIPPEYLTNTNWLQRFLIGTVAQLPKKK